MEPKNIIDAEIISRPIIQINLPTGEWAEATVKRLQECFNPVIKNLDFTVKTKPDVVEKMKSDNMVINIEASPLWK